jgi:hypothetical protein
MDDAVSEYALHSRSPEAWMLGRFVVPALRLAELAAAATPHLAEIGAAEPWRVSALLGADLGAAVAAITRFGQIEAGRALVDAVEGKATTVEAIGGILAAAPGDTAVYVEVPLEPDPTLLLRELAVRGARAKVRTGGLSADAVPTPAQLARFLAACAALHLPFKATAGLHHAVRSQQPFTYEPESSRGTMHGFLNVFTAALLLRTGAIDQSEAEGVLKEERLSAFGLSDEALTFGPHRLEAAVVQEARQGFAIAFGSCSFAEPVAGLRAWRLA